MNLSNDGLNAIKRFEGLRLNAYKDSVGVVTIGYGSTGKHVRMGMRITEAQAEKMLRSDVSRFERCVNEYTTVDLTQGQFDALVSFAFNLGCGVLKSSTLLRRLNNSEYEKAAEQFPRWDHAGGKRLAGLTLRRKQEQDTFLS